jgi:hypothetical protein
MKNLVFLCGTLLSGTLLFSQNIGDGLRYSTEQNTGTARYTALSGAMGALGNDYSAINVNPAGSAVFLKSNLMFSTTLFDVENKTDYFNHREKSFSDEAGINQFGGVFVIDNTKEQAILKKITIGLNFNTTKSFDDEIYSQGMGNKSIGNFFLEQAQGIPLSQLQLQSGETISSRYNYLGQSQGSQFQNAFLGYQAFLFDPLEPNNPSNSSYVSNLAGSQFNQEYLQLSQGNQSKFSLNIASQIGNNFFIGANLNTHTLNFEQSSYLRETNNNTNSKIKNIGFENNLSVYGVGISAQIGAIAKIASNFRLGLSFDSPTWLQISEETSQYLESKYVYNGETLFNQIDPAIINVYEDYNLRTPAKLSVSAAYIFGQKGLISFDYSYKDFSTIKFSELNNSYSPYFSALNQTIQNNLKGASSFKAGGEYRIGQLSLRGGFHFEESPYIKPNIVEELIGFSGGLGYNFGRLNANIAYSRSEQNRNQQLYSIGLTDSAEIKSVYNTFVFTLGLDF